MFKRVNSDVVPFSINSPAGNRYTFGTTDVSNDIDVNYNENIKKGFGTGPNEFPELEDFNALMFTGSYLAAYLYQAGIPEWNDKQKYYINSIAMGSDGNLYKSLTGTEEIPNVDNNPTLAGSTSWKSILSDYALINGDETKRFKVADAEEDDEAVNLKQLNEASMDINPLPDKPTPDDTDNLALQEVGGLLKKLSFANLKLWILSLFNPSITGTATFTNSTQNISLTGVGALDGLEVGDVIQITGAINSKNNSEFTVESITDANNIVVNYEHRGQATSKALTNETSTSGITIKLLAKWYNAPIGLGQGWCIPPSRALATNYTNDTNRAILVNVESAGSGSGVSSLLNGLYRTSNIGYGAIQGAIQICVNKDDVYLFTASGGLYRWSEQR